MIISRDGWYMSLYPDTVFKNPANCLLAMPEIKKDSPNGESFLKGIWLKF